MIVVRLRTRAHWIVGAPALALALTGCAAEHATDDANASTSDIYGGVKDDDAPA